MQILVVNNYDWGHALDILEKPKLELALQDTVKNLMPDHQKAEVVVVDEPEDYL